MELSQFRPYFDNLANELSNNGFAVYRSIPLGNYMLDLAASRRSAGLLKGSMAQFILGTGVGIIDLQTMLYISAQSTKFAFDNNTSLFPRGFGGSLLSVPTIVSENFPEDLKEWIEKNLPKKHFAAFEFPTLIALSERKIYYSKKTPIWGPAMYRGLREFVEEQLAF